MSFIKKIALFAALAWGVCAWPAEPLRLSDLIAEALANSPEVLAAQKNYEAARQRPAREKSLPDPTLSVGYSSNGGPLPGQQLGRNPTSNIGFSVSQEMTSAGKRRLRGEIAAKDAEAEFWQYQAVQLSVRSRMIQAFHRLHHAYAAIEILTHGKQILTETLRASEVRYTTGKTAQQEILKAQMQLSMLETRIIRMQQDRTAAEVEINSLLNRRPGSALGEPTEADLKPLAMSVDELLAKAAINSPELVRKEKMIARSELGVNLARKDFRGDYTISAGYFNQGSMSPMYQVRVDVPIHLHTEQVQRPALNEKAAVLAETRQDFAAAEQSLQFRVREAWSAAETAWRLMRLYNDTILPQSQLAVDSSLAAYQTGGADLVSVLNNLAAKVDLEEQLHEEGLAYSLAVARLEEMTGVDLFGQGGTKQ